MNLNKRILITGLPGVGKTTLMKNICQKIQELNIEVKGFYTEELRGPQTSRIGFDIVTLNGKRGKLARTRESLPHGENTKYTVGRYTVFPYEIEGLVLPLSCKANQVLIIDEIGKMELLSHRFKTEVEETFKSSQGCLVATVPLKSHQLPTVEKLKKDPSCKLYIVTRSNRDTLINEIINYITM